MAELNTLEPGDVRVGFLTDGSDDRLGPLAGTLSVNETGEIDIRMPFLRPNVDAVSPDVFALHEKAANWGQGNGTAFPKVFLFQDDRGPVILTGVRWVGNRIGFTGQAHIRAASAFLAEPKRVRGSFCVTEMESELDGLREFTRFELLRWDERLEAGSQVALPMVRQEVESTVWEAGGFTFELKPHSVTSAQDGSYGSLNETARLVTRRSSAVSVWEHLRAQRAMRAFLILNFGCQISWRGHWVRSQEFKRSMLDERVGSGLPLVPVVLERTLPDVLSPALAGRDTTFQIASLRELKVEALEEWTRSYLDEPIFRRAVDPAAEAIASAGGFVEVRIMTLAAALDFFAYNHLQKRNPMLRSQIAWCLDAAGIDWPDIGTNAEIGAKLAEVNNDLKHPDRKNLPSSELLQASLHVMETIARGQLLEELDVSDGVREWFQALPKAQDAHDLLLRACVPSENLSATGKS